MKNKIMGIIEIISLNIAAFLEAVKIKFLIIYEFLKPYIAPYQTELTWLLPVTGFLLLLLLISIGRRRRKRERAESEAVDEEPIKAVKEVSEEPVAELVEEPEPDEKTEVKVDEADEEVIVKVEEPKEAVAVRPEKPSGLLKNIRTGLEKTRKAFSLNVDRIFSGGKLDDDMLEELEELLITSDIGVKTSMEIIETIEARSSEISGPDDLKKILKQEILSYMNIEEKPVNILNSKPHVMMVVGVNGVGKTTTIGKLAFKFVQDGKKVLIVAADTFRAAAADQLEVWAERSGADIVRHKDDSDPSAVAFDGMEAAVARDVDIVIIDTAGRLHTKKNLMEELKKIQRTIVQKIPDAPHETLMVVDATTGQNALQQAKLFNDAIGITTIALTKLDGTAKGGIVIGITNSLNIPLKYVGVGEQVGDLQEFDSQEFADALI